MPQAHTLTAATSSRVRRLSPLVVVIAAAALFALAIIQSIANDPPAVEEPAVSVSRALTEQPDESAVAAAVGAGFDSAHRSQRPDESTVAAAVGGSLDSEQWSQRPDESTVAAAVSQQ